MPVFSRITPGGDIRRKNSNSGTSGHSIHCHGANGLSTDQRRDIIFGTVEFYLGRIIDCGFDGVYLDKIDSFETWVGM